MIYTDRKLQMKNEKKIRETFVNGNFSIMCAENKHVQYNKNYLGLLLMTHRLLSNSWETTEMDEEPN